MVRLAGGPAHFTLGVTALPDSSQTEVHEIMTSLITVIENYILMNVT